MRSLVERSVNCVEKLLTLYDDKDGYVCHFLVTITGWCELLLLFVQHAVFARRR